MSKKNDYEERFYRRWQRVDDLVANELSILETDVIILARKDIRSLAEAVLRKYRLCIEEYISFRPGFKEALKPLDPIGNETDIIKDMIRASKLAGTGPMAGIAGAISEFAGLELLKHSGEIIVENGGDIFLKSDRERTVSVFAGTSFLSGRIYIKIKPQDTPLGVCTSSGTVGHSLSFGKADACVIISKSTTLADTVATAACNMTKEKSDIEHALAFAMSVPGVKGALIIYEDSLGVKGEVELER